MIYFKRQEYLEHTLDAIFDKTFHAASEAPYSGIYRCDVCGLYAVSTKGHKLPPQSHHQHPQQQAISWRLIAAHN
jgi:hypothetical protein